MSTNQLSLSLFPEFDYQTKQEYREKALKRLGIVGWEGQKTPTSNVKIEKLEDYDYDLFSFDFSEEQTVSETVSHEVFEPEVVEAQKDLPRAKWEPLGVAILHERMLVSMLEDIRDKRVSQSRLEEWLCWAEGLEEDYGKPLPFSFEACCYFWDFDPDEFRHRIAYVLRHHRGWNIRWQERTH